MCVLLAASEAASAPRSPGKAMADGVPALLSESTARDWVQWKGAAVLGFFAPNQQGMGLKALAKEYKGRLPLGGVRASDTKVHKAFGVAPKDLPVILVLQSGTVSMRLGGGSNPSTLRTLINSALMSAAPPPPPTKADLRARTSAATVRVDCAKVKGPCLVLVGGGAAADKFSDTLGEQVLRVSDGVRGRLARALGYEYEPNKPALYVIKGNARPRLAKYGGEPGDREELSQFFNDLKAGQLKFASFAWEMAEDKAKGTGAEGGTGAGDGDAPSPPSPLERKPADLTAGQYAARDEEGAAEVIELEDDDE